MKTNNISMRSPKNKYFAEVTYNTPLDGIGSCSSVGAMEFGELKSEVSRLFVENARKAGGAHVVIKENIKEYPCFEWETKEAYNL